MRSKTLRLRMMAIAPGLTAQNSTSQAALRATERPSPEGLDTGDATSTAACVHSLWYPTCNRRPMGYVAVPRQRLIKACPCQPSKVSGYSSPWTRMLHGLLGEAMRSLCENAAATSAVTRLG